MSYVSDIATELFTEMAFSVNYPDMFVVCQEGGHWDFRFCGFGHFLIGFSFLHQKMRFFGFDVFCGLRVFLLLAFGFQFSSIY